MESINKLMSEYFEINSSIKDLISKKERIQAEVKLYMTEKNVNKYMNEGNLISYKEQTRKSLDKNKILQYIEPEKLDLCYRESHFSVLKIISKESLEAMKGFLK